MVVTDPILVPLHSANSVTLSVASQQRSASHVEVGDSGIIGSVETASNHQHPDQPELTVIPVSAVTFVYGLLSIIAMVAVIWFVVMLVAARFSEPVQLSLDQTRDRLSPYTLWAAFGVALLATAGSLYFSEAAHFEPCRLCWFQRIAMYPLVLILGIAAWKRDAGIRIYAVPIATIGAAISAYHYLLEWFPSIDTGACTVGIPCTAVWFREFGFASLPFLALTAFLLIIALLVIPFSDDDEAAGVDGVGGERGG